MLIISSSPVLLVCGGVVLVGRWYVNHHKREKEAIFTMVEKIVGELGMGYGWWMDLVSCC